MFDGERRAVCGVIAVAGVLAACHNAPVDNRPPLEDRLGVYRFTEHVTAGSGFGGESIDIEGQFVVFGDTVTVDARPGPCRFDTRSTKPGPFMYDCGGVKISFDRLDPIQRATYSVVLMATETRQVCARYNTDASGRRYCAEMRSETSQRPVTRTGYLRVTRVPGGGSA